MHVLIMSSSLCYKSSWMLARYLPLHRFLKSRELQEMPLPHFFHPEILRDHNVVSSGSFWVLCVLSYWKNLFITLKQNEKTCPLENCVLVIFLVVVRKYLMRSNLRKEGFSSQSEGAILHGNRSLRQLITLHPPMRSRERIMPMLSYRSPLHSVQDHRSWDSAAHIQDGSSNLS